MNRKSWLAAIPLVLGLISGILLQANLLPNPLTRYTVVLDRAFVFSIVGLTLTVLISSGLLLFYGYQRQRQHVIMQAERNQRAERRQFIQRLDHELKNPLTTIRLGVANLSHSATLTDEQKQSLGRIETQVQRLQGIIVGLRRLTELDEHTMERQPVDLRSVIETAVAVSTDEWRDRTIDIRIQEVPWPLGQVEGDHDLLVSALRNVVDNALKFIERGGLVEVRASDNGQEATIEVADNGMGIPPDDVQYIFEELYRGQNAQRRSGSGLGLTMVRRIIELHRGSIDVRSRPGQGTVLTIKLPLI